MMIQEYHRTANPDFWLRQIEAGDWSAAQYLARLLREDAFFREMGDGSRLLLLTENGQLLAFCTYARRDCIPVPELTPWAGFVYTFPRQRGRRRAGKLLEHVHALAKAEGFPCVYIATGEAGLYEKYGCIYWRTMKDSHGEDSRIYRLHVRRMDYGKILGTAVRGTVDRPLGSTHPDFPAMVYPVNYGYAEGVIGGDGEPQDVYVLGVDEPLETFTGTVIGVLHRLNDLEDKWIVTPDGRPMPREEILEAIAFQEQYYMGELYT